MTMQYKHGNQKGRGHWTVYYTSPQSFLISFSFRWLNNFRDYFRMQIEYNYDRKKYFRQFNLLIGNSFIGQFVHPI